MAFSQTVNRVVLLLAVTTLSASRIEYLGDSLGLTCKLDDLGTKFDGKIREAKNGETCLPWTHFSNFSEQAFDGKVKAQKNFCRQAMINNVTDVPEGPWCFTSQTGEKTSCGIPLCSDVSHELQVTKQCIKGNGFMSYAGTATYPDICLHWTDDVVQEMGYELWMFPGAASWKDLHNYCRNPDNDDKIWCYGYDEDKVLKKFYCPHNSTCSTDCRLTEGSLEYIGSRDYGESRRPCLKAQDMIPPIFTTEEARKKWFEEKYVNDQYSIDLTSCRSHKDQLQYGVNELGPICYVNDTDTGEIIEESCAIHYCPPTGLFEFNSHFATTTDEIMLIEQTTVRTTTPAVTTISAAAEEAWRILNSSKDIVHQSVDSPEGPYIGGAMWAATGALFLVLMLIDCSSINKCASRCKKNTAQAGDRMRELYGSRISLRSNQVSPCDSASSGNQRKSTQSRPRQGNSVV